VRPKIAGHHGEPEPPGNTEARLRNNYSIWGNAAFLRTSPRSPAATPRLRHDRRLHGDQLRHVETQGAPDTVRLSFADRYFGPNDRRKTQ
jgi:hypothetical protein